MANAGNNVLDENNVNDPASATQGTSSIARELASSSDRELTTEGLSS